MEIVVGRYKVSMNGCGSNLLTSSSFHPSTADLDRWPARTFIFTARLFPGFLSARPWMGHMQETRIFKSCARGFDQIGRRDLSLVA